LVTQNDCNCVCEKGPRAAALGLFSSTMCSMPCGSASLQEGDCVSVSTASKDCVATGLSYQTGAPNFCTGSPTTLPPPKWNIETRICKATTETDCGSQSTCLPPRPAGTLVCVQPPANESCLPPWDKKLDRFGTLSDSRICSACACGPEQPLQGKITMHSSSSCSNASGNDLAVPTICTVAPAGILQQYLRFEPASSPDCAVTVNSQLEGTAKLEDPVRLCCIPPP
jgi:hypothetical protein